MFQTNTNPINSLPGFQRNAQQSDLKMYENLLALNNQSLSPKIGQGYRTVFTDIAAEWNECSDEEKEFIVTNKLYIEADLQYQQNFNAFLIELVGLQFVNSPYGKSAEGLLQAIKESRKKFVSETQSKQKSIEKENGELSTQNQQLYIQNQQLKEELQNLRKILGEKING